MIGLLASFLTLASHAQAQKPAAERKTVSTDERVDDLLEQKRRASAAAQALPDTLFAFDQTTLGKAYQQLAQAPNLRPSPRVLTGGRGMKRWSIKVPPRLTQQRLVSLGANPSDTKASSQFNRKESVSKAVGLEQEQHVVDMDKLSPTLEKVLEVNDEEASTELTNQLEPMGVKVECAPGAEKGGENCDLIFEVKLTLEPAVAAAIRWKKARSMQSRPVVVVESVAEDSEAYRSGMRPGMVVKTLIGGSGRHENEAWEMSKLRAINMRNFKDGIRLARYPITFVMLEGVKLGSEDMITNEDKRIAAAYARRKYIEEVDEQKIGEGRDFPIVGLMFGATVLPPTVILALNAYFGWYTGYVPPHH